VENKSIAETAGGESPKSFYYRRMLTVTIPVVIQHLIDIGLNLADSVMIGRLGEQALAATGSANQIFGIFGSLCFGFFSGATVYVAQYFGAKDARSIRKIFGFQVAVGTLIGIVFFAVTNAFTEPLLGIFTNESRVIDYGAQYIRIVSFSYVPTAISFAISFNSRSIQRVTAVTAISGVALSLNVLLNWFLIYGPGPFPALGVRGAAIATLIARLVELVSLIIYLAVTKDHIFHAPFRELFVWDGELYKKVFKTSIPVLCSETGWSLGASLVFATYGRLGSAAQAVIQVASLTCQVFQSVIFGFGSGAAVVIGETLGRKDVDEAVDHAKRTLRIACVLIAIMVGGSLAIMKPIGIAYDFKPETTELMYRAVTVYTFAMVPRMMAYVLQCGILRAGGDTLFCMITELTGNLVIELAMANVAVVLLGWDLPAAIALASLGNIFKMTANYLRYRSRKWINIVI
jgi:putative MATE family efflux protein